ncbi:conserved hypothetical protein [Pyrobaculum islandicum DSM 4184]|uniref:Uncharacterized protein n=1 Tax=Pyrobaculum islandicum (strain DSM 4184 / JCM 9189 / GEO3) TaxID=384616 RepID=A1RTE2_PYRIL|nr:hypothetical protein [Pyrobaculum islandicum]ABL88224.1 conserved hypothetical protein [Pyrobaculum islandicum DSM 4184]
MSMKDLNVVIKELVDKEIEKAMANIKEEIREVTSLIDKKIEELRQYLKT